VRGTKIIGTGWAVVAGDLMVAWGSTELAAWRRATGASQTQVERKIAEYKSRGLRACRVEVREIYSDD
jgi:hypothetical protein